MIPERSPCSHTFCSMFTAGWSEEAVDPSNASREQVVPQELRRPVDFVAVNVVGSVGMSRVPWQECPHCEVYRIYAISRSAGPLRQSHHQSSSSTAQAWHAALRRTELSEFSLAFACFFCMFFSHVFLKPSDSDLAALVGLNFYQPSIGRLQRWIWKLSAA